MNFTSLLILLVQIFEVLNLVKLVSTNANVLKLDKSKLANLTCNDNHFRVQLVFNWLNQSSLTISDDEKLVLAYKYSPCVIEEDDDDDLISGKSQNRTCQEETIVLSQLGAKNTLRIIYNSYFQYQFQILAASRIPIDGGHLSNISTNSILDTSLSVWFPASLNKTAKFQYLTRQICANFTMEKLKDCHHYELNVYDSNNCTFSITNTYSSSLIVKYLYFCICVLLVIALLSNVIKSTFFKQKYFSIK